MPDEKKYIGARTLWSSACSIDGDIYNPGDLLPPEIMSERQAIARNDMLPEYEEPAKTKIKQEAPVSAAAETKGKVISAKGKSGTGRGKKSLA